MRKKIASNISYRSHCISTELTAVNMHCSMYALIYEINILTYSPTDFTSKGIKSIDIAQCIFRN